MRVPKFLENAYDWVRYDLPAKYDRRTLAIGGAALAVLIVIVLAVAGVFSGGPETETRVVTIAVKSDNAQQAPVGVLGFPVVATRNTTRISGSDPTDDAAAAALATHPPAPAAPPVQAAVMVGDDDWQAGIAASVLSGPPLRAPVLIGQPGGVPDPTSQALAQLDPSGGKGKGVAAVYVADGVAAPSGLKEQAIPGDSPAAIAASIDELRQRLLRNQPAHVVIASSDDAGYAMPAAAWAARSGDPVLFSGRDEVPEATLSALRRHQGAAVYILGPASVISKTAEQQIDKVSGGSQRVGFPGAVQNSIGFARYSDSSFGWNINDPGHGMVVANVDRPLDAAAAASLSSSGKWGPLLLTDTADTLPPELRSFLLDIKPGYESDPTRAVYNHVWLMGDATAIGAEAQAEIDQLAELAPVGGAAQSAQASGGIAQPGGAEGEPSQIPGKKK